MAEDRFPVSVKGVILDQGRVVLLRNDRAEWELPGGKLETDEVPEACVAREIREELNVQIKVGPLLDAWVYEPLPEARVLVLAYGCAAKDSAGMEYSGEHWDVGLFGEDELDGIRLPPGYVRSVRAWMRRQ